MLCLKTSGHMLMIKIYMIGESKMNVKTYMNKKRAETIKFGAIFHNWQHHEKTSPARFCMLAWPYVNRIRMVSQSGLGRFLKLEPNVFLWRVIRFCGKHVNCVWKGFPTWIREQINLLYIVFTLSFLSTTAPPSLLLHGQ